MAKKPNRKKILTMVVVAAGITLILACLWKDVLQAEHSMYREGAAIGRSPSAVYMQ